MNNQLLAPGEGKSLMELTKAERVDAAKTVVQQVKDGNMKALDVLQSVRSAEDMFKKITGDEQFAQIALDEMALHGKSTVLNGNKVEQSEAGVSFDYSVCNDPELARLEKELAEAKERVDARQKFLKALPAKGYEELDVDSGEVRTRYPPARTSKTIVKVTLK